MRVLLKLALIGLLWGGLISSSSAQPVGQLQPGQAWGNKTGSQAPASGSTIQQLLAQSGLTSLAINGCTIGSNAFCVTGSSALAAMTASGTANFTGTFEIGGTTETFPSSGNLVGTTDSQSLTNKSYNGLTITANGGNTLSIAAGKTFTLSNSLTLTGTDGTSFAFPGASDTVVTLAATQTLTNKTLASSTDVLGGVTMTLGSDAAGDLYYRNSSGILTRIPIGSNGQVLQVNSLLPSWQAGSSAGSITAGSTGIGSCTSGYILWDNAGTLACAALPGFLTAGAGISITGSTSATLAVSLTTASNVLGSDVSLSSTSTYFDGPSMAQGSTGVWAAYGSVTVLDTAGGADIFCKLWDGTNAPVDVGTMTTVTANNAFSIHLSGNISSPAGNIRISCKDSSSTSGKIKFNSSGLSVDSVISGHRIQ